MKVYLIGVGMGNIDTLTVGAQRAIEGSDLLIGAERLLAPFEYVDCPKLPLIYSDDIVEALRVSGAAQASILLSGDVGFYSGATSLYDKLEGFDVRVIPGISSLVYFCAKLHKPWQDATLVSAHGRQHDAAGAIQSHPKTFCITGGQTKVEDICAELAQRDMGSVHVWAGERLSYDDERIVEGTAEELSHMNFLNLSVMLAENDAPVQRAYAAPYLADGDFQRGRAPMTKEEVRALIIAKLRIEPAHTVWDVGAGTGSVSVEAALAAPMGTVYAVERSEDAVNLMRENREALGAWNMQVVEGEAPQALEGLPAPDRVFIGGSAGNMERIVSLALEANPLVRICATAVTLETAAELLATVRHQGFADVDIVQVSVARADNVGAYHLMRAENPVYIFTFQYGRAYDV